MLSLFKFAGIAAIAVSSAAVVGAQGVTSATKPFSLGISGGASIPLGDLSNAYGTGYNIGGHVALGAPGLPVGFRGDVNYDNFGSKGSSTGNTHIWSYTANAVFGVPVVPGISPYVIGGIGGFMPGSSYTSGGTTLTASSGTKFGFDVGAGVTIPLSGFNAFIEARYNRFNNGGGGSTSFVPITFGVMF